MLSPKLERRGLPQLSQLLVAPGDTTVQSSAHFPPWLVFPFLFVLVPLV